MVLQAYQWLREKITSGAVDPFQDVVFDDHKVTRARARARPDIRYSVIFAPRIGSSRLDDVADLAEPTKVLGKPGECFHPTFVPGIAQAYSARSMSEYVALVLRNRQTPGADACHTCCRPDARPADSGQSNPLASP
ncbi:MAG: hypothetical protein AAGF79_07200 [Pseudomonadota bacterium]